MSAPPEAHRDTAVLDGVLERVTFANPETGYMIARIDPGRGGPDLITAVGPLLGAQVGESLRMRGRWTTHPKYGKQFEVFSYTIVLPATVQGIQRYLGSGLIKGIGPVMAEHGQPLRRRHHAHHRGRAGPPDRGGRPRSQADRDDHRCLGRAEGDQRGDGVPAGRWRIYVPGRPDLQADLGGPRRRPPP